MSWSQQLRFLCGQLGINLVVRYFFTWQLKFVDQPTARGTPLLDAGAVGAWFFGARIFDAVTDPLAGALCDRWVESGRQRSALLWYAFALPGAALVLIFSPQGSWSEGGRWGALLPGMFLLFAGYTFYAIPYWSLVRDYAASSADEQRNSEKLGVGLLLATGGVAILSPLCVARFGYLEGAVVFGVVGGALMLLPIGARPRSGGAPRPQSTPAERSGPLRRFGEALGHRRFAAVLALYCGSQMAFTVITAASPFIAVALLGGTEQDVARLMAPLMVTAVPSALFLVGPAARRGWQRAVTGASLGLAVVYAGAGALGRAVIGSPMTTAMVLFALAGPMVAVILGLEAKAIVDCAREQEQRAGGERTSLYFGVFNLVVKGLNGLASMCVGFLVSLSHRPGWETGAVRGMGLLAGGLLALGVLGYFALAGRRPSAGRR